MGTVDGAGLGAEEYGVATAARYVVLTDRRTSVIGNASDQDTSTDSP